MRHELRNGLALALLVLLAGSAAAGAHEPTVVPIKRRAQRAPLLIPGFTGENHLAPSPAALAFGTITVGQPATRPVTLANTSARSVTVATAAPAGMTVSPAQVTLAPAGAAGSSAPLQVTYTPAATGAFSGALDLLVTHADVTAVRYEGVPFSGQAVVGARLEVLVGGQSVDRIEFGLSTRWFHAPGDAPSVPVTIHNSGDAPAAFDIAFHPTGGSILGAFGCTLGNPSLCFTEPDGLTTLVPQTIPPGGTLETAWVLYPSAVAGFRRSFQVLGGAQPKVIEVTAAPVPFALGPAAAQGSSSQATATSGGPVALAAPIQEQDHWVPNSDPFADDPLGVFRPKGLDPRSIFSLGEVDVVDLRSGNLVFFVPLGGEIPARGGLSYQLQAVYNSDCWARRTMYDPRSSTPQADLPHFTPYENMEYPDPTQNSGMCWAVHLGRLLEPATPTLDATRGWRGIEEYIETGPYFVYVAPDGARRKFSEGLNHAISPHTPEPGPEYFAKKYLYDRSGAHLRLNKMSETERRVEFPDGTYHVFQKLASPPPAHPDGWILTRIADRFGNEVRIDYSQANRWVIRDNGNRSGGTPAAQAWRTTTVDLLPGTLTVDKVTLPGFAGGAPRVHQFHYTRNLLIDRPRTSVWHLNVVGEDVRAQVDRLDRITLPDGTEYAFTYHTDPDRNFKLQSVALPTGGRAEYQFEAVRDEPGDCAGKSAFLTLIPTFGVARRTLRGAALEVLEDTRYLRQLRRDPLVHGHVCRQVMVPPYRVPGPSTDQVVGVWKLHESSPGGSSLSVHHFSVFPLPVDCPLILNVVFGAGTCPGSAATASGWSNRDRNLPFTRRTDERDGDRFLSQRLYSCAFDLAHPVPPLSPIQLHDHNVLGLAEQCTRHETTYVKYERPRADHCDLTTSSCHEGSRPVKSKVVHDADSNRFATEDKSEYDGLGHHRRSVTGGNFTSGNVVTSYQNWNAGAGILLLDDNGNVTQDVTLPTEPWLLETYKEKWVEEGGVRQGGEARFDAGTGRVRFERTWSGSAAGPKDLVVLDKYSPEGELALQRFFGADTYSGTGLTAADWDATAKEASYWAASLQDYALQLEYQFGLLSRKRVTGQTVFEVWRDVDQATGWTAEETLSTGEELTHSYDPLGRVTAIRSDVAADREFQYLKPANSGTGAWKLIARAYRRGEGSATGHSALTRYEADFDGIGRVATERVFHPSGTPSAQTTVYHPSGQIKSRSMVNDPSKKLTARHDVRGRPLSVDKPDGTSSTFTYSGMRVAQQRSAVGSGPGAVTGVTRIERDRQGRTIVIDRGQLVGGSVQPLTTTTLAHDPQGRVKQASRGQQQRTMAYDGRGFLLSEAIPERATVVHHSNFNTRGQARTVTHKIGATVRRSASHAYDRLGRPTSLTVDGDLLKSWTYHACDLDGLAGGDLGNCPGSNGQLHVALRNNFRTAADTGGVVCSAAFPCARGRFSAAQTHTYDAAGRTATRMTDVDFDRLNASGGLIDHTDSGLFDQSWGYEDTGWVTRTDYPAVCTPGNPPACGTARQVDYSHVRGFLTGVVESGLGASVSYHPDGTIHQVTHNSGGTDTYDRDLSGLSRVRTITLAGTSLTLGPYAYDASGNVLSIGGVGDSYGYDPVSRLTSASILNGSETYSYAYDQYDNLQWGTISTATNQWTGGGNGYDDFGNWIAAPGGGSMRYDPLDKITAMFDTAGAATSCSGAAANCTLSIYDASDLRILETRHGQGPHTWTIRDLDGKVLSELRGLGSAVRKRDYVYAGSRLIASRDELEGRIRHYHLDHLGTPRVVTSPGFTTEFSHYSPYGVEIQSATGETVAGFTGHERDGEGLFATNSMRARQYLPAGGRFMQVDPGRDRSAWSQYAYAGVNPLRYVDARGLEAEESTAVIMPLYYAVAGANLGGAPPPGESRPTPPPPTIGPMTESLRQKQAEFERDKAAVRDLLGLPPDSDDAVTKLVWTLNKATGGATADERLLRALRSNTTRNQLTARNQPELPVTAGQPAPTELGPKPPQRPPSPEKIMAQRAREVADSYRIRLLQKRRIRR